MGRGLGWVTHRGPCQPPPFCDSVISTVQKSGHRGRRCLQRPCWGGRADTRCLPKLGCVPGHRAARDSSPGWDAAGENRPLSLVPFQARLRGDSRSCHLAGGQPRQQEQHLTCIKTPKPQNRPCLRARGVRPALPEGRFPRAVSSAREKSPRPCAESSETTE